MNTTVTAIIPALNEQEAIRDVIRSLLDFVDEVIVADNGSTDQTANIATSAGATVIYEPKKGYGAACLAAMNQIKKSDIILFADGDGADDTSHITELLSPIISGKSDFVLGSRMSGLNKKLMLPHSRLGNWVFSKTINLLYGTNYTDLGPLRAISYHSLIKLGMADQNFGWTAEMQIKAAKNNLKITEIPVNYRIRKGHSKVTGSPKASILAAIKIVYTILKLRIS